MPAQPAAHEPLTEDHLAQLVQVFYGRARAHPELGPLFNTAVVDWDHHLAVVQGFWSHTLLGTTRYGGHPFPVHMGLPIRREHFGQWLELFRPAARETLPEGAARAAIAKAEHMAESFRAGLFPFDPIEPRPVPGPFPR
ncbi:group III truncated hemoglobin [Ideonella sp. B508-1]|uniref:group III truncated hemoglobin n=1 Tax=Ideonella sp. B508-1 TaxID=137716 RepID=UPI000345C19A|nr:group III truncated hemoglobin [Ideonella sp. B508-1]